MLHSSKFITINHKTKEEMRQQEIGKKKQLRRNSVPGKTNENILKEHQIKEKKENISAYSKCLLNL